MKNITMQLRRKVTFLEANCKVWSFWTYSCENVAYTCLKKSNALSSYASDLVYLLKFVMEND